MKTLCGKAGKGGGGKIHPAPVQEDPIRAAFRDLPVTILVLVVALGIEARELLAYFVTCPLDGWLAKDATAGAASPSAPARGGGGGRGGGGSRRRVGCTPAFRAVSHPPTIGCGCVDCYFSFWARWDRSPERDLINEALSAVEEHLAASSAATPPSSSKRREKGKRRKLHATTPPPPPPLPTPPRRAKTPEPKVVEAVPEPASPLPLSCPPPPPTPAPTWCAAAKQEVENAVPEPAAKAEAEECREISAAEGKRGWADVLMGGGLGRTLREMLFHQPAVLSAT